MPPSAKTNSFLDTDCCRRQCCGKLRSFTLRITDNSGREVITMERPYRCDSAWCLCLPINFFCLQEMTVTSTLSNQVLGTIKQKYHLWYVP